MIKGRKTAIHIDKFLMGAAFIAYFISLFLDDLSVRRTQIIEVTSGILKVSSALIATSIIIFDTLKNIKSYRIPKRGLVLLLFAFLVYIMTGSFFFIAVVILAMASNRRNEDGELFKKSFRCLIILSCLALILARIGILENIVTIRSVYDTGERYSLGFYHSNVFPAIIFYLTAFYIMICKNKVKVSHLTIFMILSIIAYYFCNSRGALLSSVVLIILTIILVATKSKYITKISSIIEPKKTITACLVVSYSFMILSTKTFYNSFISYIDSFFSGRAISSAIKMERIGIHLIPQLSNKEYSKDFIIVDNAYAYTVLRYGILSIIFFALSILSLAKKYSKHPLCLICISTVCIMNLIDNDFYSYCFLPFLVTGLEYFISNKRLSDGKKS